jgi:hypothetical protein
MAVGAVALSLSVATLGSLWISIMNGLALWQGVATYSALGFVALLSILSIAAVEVTFSDRNTSRGHARR